MNKRNINKLIKHLKTNFTEVGFNMHSYGLSHDLSDTSGRNCETVCCLAGHAVLMNAVDPSSVVVKRYAQRFLGLTYKQAHDLFEPIIPYNWSSITPAVAIAVLENFKRTGVIDYLTVLRAGR